MGKRAIIILFTFIVIMCPAFLFAPFFSSEAASDKVVKVGYYETEVFQEGADDDAKKNGYAYEYYIKLSEYTGWRYEYVYGNFPDLYQKLVDGEIDIMAGLAKSEDREGLIGYPDAPMGNETYNLIKHKENDRITSDPSTLNGKCIGVIDNYIAQKLKEFLNSNDVDAEIIKYLDYEKMFSSFDNNKIDVVAVGGDGVYSRENAEFFCTFGKQDYYICTSIKKPELLEELNEAQTQLEIQEPNYFNVLSAKYYQNSEYSRAFSTKEKEWLDGHNSMKVGYLNDYLPYSDTDSDGNVVGIVSELIDKMLEKLDISGIKVTYQGFDSYDDMIKSIGSGEIDVAYPVGGGIYYSEQSGIYQSNPFVKPSVELVYLGEYNDDLTKNIAVNKNNRMQYYYTINNFPDSEIIFCNSAEACLDAILAGDADSTTLSGMRASDILKNNKYRDFSSKELSQGDDRCMGVKIGNEGLLKIINRGLDVVGYDYARNLAYKYSEKLYSYSFGDMIKDNIVVILFVVCFVVGLIIVFLIHDSRHAKRTQRELADALESAERADGAKSAFLNNMSHDIRTPVSAIVGFSELASQNTDKTELVKDYLKKIRISSDHLLSIIDDVLDMSSIESGKMVLSEDYNQIIEIINEVRSIIQPGADEKHQEFFVEMSEIKNKRIVTDRVRLRQVLVNVLSNAVKFTPDEGMVRLFVNEKVSGVPDRASFEFRVKDNGIGIDEEFMDILFEPFAIEHTSSVKGESGTGLGLAITKRIVDMMGGEIEVNSTVSEGTEFVISISFRTGK